MLSIQIKKCIEIGTPIYKQKYKQCEKIASDNFKVVIGGNKEEEDEENLSNLGKAQDQQEQQNLYQNSYYGECLAVITKFKHLRSLIGHLLAEKSEQQGLQPIGIVGYIKEEDPKYLNLSFRSTQKSVNCARICKEISNGGGHECAAGCVVKLNDFLEWEIE